MRGVLGLAAACTAATAISASAEAKVISFEEFQGFTSLVSEGVRDTYQGYAWGFGFQGGPGNRIMWDAPQGWGVSGVADYYNPPPHGVSGSNFAWNYNGPQSLWIDFRTLTDVVSADFAFAISRDEPSNSRTIRLFGYGADDQLLFDTSALTLTDTMQTLQANFKGVRYLEIRAEDDRKWFSVDNIVLGGVPEPSVWGLMILGFGVAGGSIRHRRRSPVAGRV